MATHRIEGRFLSETRKISEGGFAFVVEVRDRGTNETFALKKMGVNRDNEKMIEREVDLMKNLPSLGGLLTADECAHFAAEMIRLMGAGMFLLKF